MTTEKSLSENQESSSNQNKEDRPKSNVKPILRDTLVFQESVKVNLSNESSKD